MGWNKSQGADVGAGIFDAQHQIFKLDPVPDTDAPIADNSDPNLIANWYTLLDYNTTDLSPGESFKVFVQCIWSLSTASRSAIFRVTIDGVTLLPLYLEPKDPTSDEKDPVTIYPIELSPAFASWENGGVHNVKLECVIEAGGGNPTLTITDCYLTVERKR